MHPKWIIQYQKNATALFKNVIKIIIAKRKIKENITLLMVLIETRDLVAFDSPTVSLTTLKRNQISFDNK